MIKESIINRGHIEKNIERGSKGDVMIATVVVPVYNGENYIKKCLDSLLNQTVDYYKIIVVNDGSTDDTQGILEEYKKMSKIAFEIIEKKNGGLSSARNAGIKKANTEYILFVDSDDYVEPDYVEVLCRAIQTMEADIVCCGYEYRGKMDQVVHGVKKPKVMLLKEKPSLVCDLDVIAPNKIYKTSLFKENNIYYPMKAIFEDSATTPRLVAHSKKIGFVPNCLYHYIFRTGSIMDNKDKYLGHYFKVLDTLNADDKREVFRDEYDYLNFFYMRQYIGAILNGNTKCDVEVERAFLYMKKHILGNIKSNPYYLKQISKLNKKGRIVEFCLLHEMWRTVKIMNKIVLIYNRRRGN